MKHVLPDLPYSMTGLQPYLSAETLEFHWGKHHRTYVDKLNALIPGTEFEGMSLEEIVKKATGPIFNNAAQTWNHTFYWNSLTAEKTHPEGDFLKIIKRDFSTVEQFTEQFHQAAVGVFGSGWAWLVMSEKDQKLSIETTSNAENPLRLGRKPLLNFDVWEHAYYIDYRNDRAKYLKTLLPLLNWQFAESNWKQASVL